MKHMTKKLLTAELETTTLTANDAREIFLQALPELSEPLKSAVEFTLAHWHELNESKRNAPSWKKVENLPDEEWRDVVGYEGLYMVSNMGRVKSFYSIGERLLTPSANKSGYMYVVLTDRNGGRKSCKVHTLVARAFLPNPENKPVVHHRDRNRQNNCVENLEWVTHQENSIHAILSGSYDKEGVYVNPAARLTRDDVRYIRKHYIKGDPEFGQTALAKKFNVSKNTIIRVVNREYYKDVI